MKFTGRYSKAAGLLLALLMLAATARAGARTVLVIKSADIPQYQAPLDAFRRSAGTETIVIDLGGSRQGGEAAIRKALEAGKPDAIFALGGQAAWLGRRVLPDTPLVFAMVLGWQRYGLNEGAVTGVAVEMPAHDVLTRLKLVFPHVKKVGLITSEQTLAQRTESIRKAAAGLAIEVFEEKVRHSDDVPGAYRRMRTEIDALWMLPDPLVVTRNNFAYLEERSKRDGIGFLAFSENFVRAGALVSVAPSYETMGSQAATLLGRLIEDSGRPPAVQAPLGSRLVINAATMRTLGLEIDSDTIKMADTLVDPAAE